MKSGSVLDVKGREEKDGSLAIVREAKLMFFQDQLPKYLQSFTLNI